MAAGGDCLEDVERLRSDAGLEMAVGKMPSAEAVRFFLYGFHDEELLSFLATDYGRIVVGCGAVSPQFKILWRR